MQLALGPVAGESTLVDADISTVSGAADKVVLLSGPEPFVIHFEAFAFWDPTLQARAMNYTALHHRRHLLPVHTVLVVLRPEADHRSLTGGYRVDVPVTGHIHLLQYQLLRTWELDLDAVLQGSLATLPLAPLTDAARAAFGSAAADGNPPGRGGFQYRQSGGVSAEAARVVIKKQKAPFQIVNNAGQVLTHTDQFTLNGNLEARILLTNPHQNSSYTGSISMHGSGLNGGDTFVYDEQGRTLGAMAATSTGGVFFLWNTNGNATFAAP